MSKITKDYNPPTASSPTKVGAPEIEELMKIPGKARGQVFFTDFEYIKELKGKKGTALLKKRMEDLGKPIDYENIKTTEWYPVGLRVISLLIIKEVFDWDDRDIEEMGKTAPKLSFIVKMLMKTFLSTERSLMETANYWKKHYSIGKLAPFEIDMKRKHTFLHLKDFKIHPIFCPYLTGYFYTIANFILKSEKVTIKETKCAFKGAALHEFSVRWE